MKKTKITIGILFAILFAACSTDQTVIENEEVSVGLAKVVNGGEGERTSLHVQDEYLNETYQVGDQINIHWTGTLCICDWSASEIDIHLYDDYAFDRVIATNVDATGSFGSYIWTIPNDVADNSEYRIMIIGDDSGESASSDFFEIVNIIEDIENAITFPSDGYDTAYNVDVQWNQAVFSGKVNIKIYVDGSLTTSEINYNNTGSYNLNVWGGYDGEIKFVLIDSQDTSRLDEVVFDLYAD